MIKNIYKFTKGSILYIDILGFSKIIERAPLPDLVKILNCLYKRSVDALHSYTRYTIKRKLGNLENLQQMGLPKNYIKLTKDVLNLKDTLDSYFFSDTIVVYTRKSGKKAFNHLIRFAEILFTHMIHLKIPLRGAISFGEFYVNTRKHIFIGKAFLEAHRYAEEQDWIGLIITPSAQSVALDDKNYVPYRLCFYDVPFHNNKSKKLLTLCLEEHPKFPDVIHKNLSELRDTQIDQSIKEKYNKTISFIDQKIKPICDLILEKKIDE